MTSAIRRTCLRACLLTCASVASAIAALSGSRTAFAADDWPSRAVTIIYPYAAGSASDTMTRLVADILSKALGQTFVVEYRPGAGGSIALEHVSRAAPDGYTLGLSASGNMAVNPHVYKLRYDTVSDLASIMTLVEIPFVVVTNLEFPAHNLKEFIAYNKKNPGTVTFGNSGTGTQAHLTQVLFNRASGIDPIIVPYKGGPLAVNDLLGGHLDAMIDNAASQVPHINAGKVRPLFVSSATRTTALPTVPTAREAGLDDFETSGWFGLVAPKGTPAAIIERIQRTVAKAFAEPTTRQRLTDAGWTLAPSTPQEALARVKADREALGIAAKAAGLQPN